MDLLHARRIEMGEPRADPDSLVLTRANRAINCLRGLPTIPAKPSVRDATVAIVGFGPSLVDSWRTMLTYTDTVWTTSKAHDFLLNKGVKPTIHTDVDPHEHKAKFIKEFQGDVAYILATHVNPLYLERAAGYNTRLFHSMVPQGSPYEPGYVKVPAMFDAGLQAAKLAYDAGYRVQHWFGMDASFRGTVGHAGPHEGFLLGADPHQVVVGKKTYDTNALLLRQALWSEKMLRDHPKMRVTIHGDGMLGPFLADRGKVR